MFRPDHSRYRIFRYRSSQRALENFSGQASKLNTVEERQQQTQLQARRERANASVWTYHRMSASAAADLEDHVDRTRWIENGKETENVNKGWKDGSVGNELA